LIADDPGEHVPAVGQHHDEDSGLAHQAHSRAEEPACESEVDLCDIAQIRLNWVDDILGTHATLSGDAPGGTLDRRNAAIERGALSAHTVPDGLGTNASLEVGPDGGQPHVNGGGDLAGCGWWPLSLDGCAQDAELRQLGGVAREQTGRVESQPVALLGPGAQSEESRPLSNTCSETVKPNQLLWSMHIRPRCTHWWPPLRRDKSAKDAAAVQGVHSERGPLTRPPVWFVHPP